MVLPVVAATSMRATRASVDAQRSGAKQVRKANEHFYAALNTMFTGDVGPMLAGWSYADDVIDMGPLGNRSAGWDAVRKQFKQEAGLKISGKVEQLLRKPRSASRGRLGFARLE